MQTKECTCETSTGANELPIETMIEALRKEYYEKGYQDGFNAVLDKLVLKGCGYEAMANDGRSAPIVWLNGYPVDGQQIYVIDGENPLETRIVLNSPLIQAAPERRQTTRSKKDIN